MVMSRLTIIRVWSSDILIRKINQMMLLSPHFCAMVSIEAFSASHNRTVDHLIGVRCEDLKCHGVSNVFRNTYKMAVSFYCFRRKLGIVMHVVDLFPTTEAKDRTDIVGRSIESLYGDTFD